MGREAFSEASLQGCRRCHHGCGGRQLYATSPEKLCRSGLWRGRQAETQVLHAEEFGLYPEGSRKPLNGF